MKILIGVYLVPCPYLPILLPSHGVLITAHSAACENALSEAATTAKQAEMRLRSAQAELKEKERVSKNSEHTYSKDKAIYDAACSEVSRLEVSCAFVLVGLEWRDA